MGRERERRRLVVNADDFGRSASINKAVARAHCDGLLTTASLMVNEPAFEQAVAFAHENPSLGVGLHLTLLCGHSALSQERIPGLVNARNEFSNHPARAGSAATIAQLFDSVLMSIQTEDVLSLAPLERLEAAARETKL